MSQSIKLFLEAVEKRNPNEPEFLQAVHEVAETVIPFIEENKKYQNKMLLERMVEAERVITFRVVWLDDA
jgi:glutamate dehydrogenase (NADP+)